MKSDRSNFSLITRLTLQVETVGLVPNLKFVLIEAKPRGRKARLEAAENETEEQSSDRRRLLRGSKCQRLILWTGSVGFSVVLMYLQLPVEELSKCSLSRKKQTDKEMARLDHQMKI